MSKKVLWYVILGLFCCSAFAYVAKSGAQVSRAQMHAMKISQEVQQLETLVAKGVATPDQVARLEELRAQLPTSGVAAPQLAKGHCITTLEP